MASVGAVVLHVKSNANFTDPSPSWGDTRERKTLGISLPVPVVGRIPMDEPPLVRLTEGAILLGVAFMSPGPGSLLARPDARVAEAAEVPTRVLGV